ncbi:hypothetical protein [Jatrophihabitans sp.]|uniref:hypothetical protein n=1 Tax=Jatrophihabitans sp. TaxID=1932789 RepID=UPI002B797EB1|nr:hypothetical protein [Jatrophihabitans sp.]
MKLSDAVVVAEAGGWSTFLPGLPISGHGGTFDEAVSDLVSALREYAGDWNDHLYFAPNHRWNVELVQLVELSTDEQLQEWILGPGR